jgi:adenylate cyclase
MTLHMTALSIMVHNARVSIDRVTVLEHEVARLRHRLEVIRHIDRIRDGHEPFDQKLDTICRVIAELVGADVGFVMLFDLTGHALELRAVTQGQLHQDAAFRAITQRFAWETVESGRLMRREGLAAPWLGYIGVPLVLRDEVIGVLGAIRGAQHHPFDEDDEVILIDVAGQADTAVFENRERLRVRQAFGRYVHPHVVQQLLERGDTDVLSPQRQTLTVLFSDIRGFTSMSEDRDPQFVVKLLDEHLDAMAEVVMEAGGTVDKFVGDEVMALFGAPLPMEDHAVRAVRVAQAMCRRQQALSAEWKSRGWPALEIGVGLNTGPMMVGNIGSERMSNYTVIGAAVNLGARLCGAAGGTQILLSEATAALVQHEIPLRVVEPFVLKGIPEPVPAWEVAS